MFGVESNESMRLKRNLQWRKRSAAGAERCQMVSHNVSVGVFDFVQSLVAAKRFCKKASLLPGQIIVSKVVRENEE